MQPPRDYPIETCDQTIGDDTAELTCGALLDRYAAEKPITHEMIHIACSKMDAAQQFPFAPAEKTTVAKLKQMFRTIF